VKPNAFTGRTKAPTDRDVAAALGDAKPVWDSIVAGMAEELGLDREWKTYGVKFGWALRLKKGKRNIVHIGPCEGSFTVLFILGERALSAARASGRSRAWAKLLDDAPHYPEGTGIRLDVRSAKDVAVVKKLAKIKLDN
jgi:hypothetical protein